VVLIQQERWVHNVSYAHLVATIDVVLYVFFDETGGVRTPTELLLKFLKRCTGSPRTKLKKKNR
jgi:hypothetical protein